MKILQTELKEREMKAAKIKTASGTWCYVKPKNWLQRRHFTKSRGYEYVCSPVYQDAFVRKLIKKAPDSAA